MSHWYLRNRGRVMGPFDRDAIRAMIANGQAEGYHECSADRREWRPLDLIPEFAPERHVRRSKPGSEPAVPLAPASGREERRGIGFNAFGAVVAAAVLLILIGGSTTLYLVLRKPTDLAKATDGKGSPGAISLSGKSDTEKTEIFERSICFVVPGQRLTTREGKQLEGFLLPTKVMADGVQFSGGTGSGFAISADGYILTNRHVVLAFDEYRKSETLRNYAASFKEVVPQIWVFFGKDGKYPATLVHVSPSHDLAVLKIDALTPNYFALCDTPPDTFPTIGACLTVGYPGKDGEQIDVKGKMDELIRSQEGKQSGFLFPSVQKAFHDDRFSPSRRNATVTQRPKLKRMEDDDRDSYLLSLEATIRGGNSGGPLAAKDGTVIGINTWSKKDSDSDSFALMMHQLRREIDKHAPGAVWRAHPE